MYTFHATLHALPQAARPGTPFTHGKNSWPTLDVRRESLGTTTFACTFEEAAAQLEQLPRMYHEPDGSFVWVSSQQDTPWQVDGNLYDRNDRLLFVDLKGTCPPDQFDKLLTAFGWPHTPIMFQLVREAVFLDETTFRKWACGAMPS
jgi:hypothetical protein